MGAKISIDKHVSNLHELLEMSAQYFQKVKFESKISGDLTQHLKVFSSLNQLPGAFRMKYSSFCHISSIVPNELRIILNG